MYPAGYGRRHIVDWRQTARNSCKAAGAEGMVVGGSVQLCMWVRKSNGRNVRFRAKDGVVLSGAQIAGSLDLSGAHFAGPLRAEGIQIGASALLTSWNKRDASVAFVAESDVIFNSASIGAAFELAGVRIGSDSRPTQFVLTDGRAGVLKDQGAQGFGAGVQLKLDGFQYDRIILVVHNVQPDAGKSTWKSQEFALAATLAAVALTYGLREALSLAPWVSWVGGALSLTLVGWLVWNARSRQPVRERKKWLLLQYAGGKPSAREFNPDPYERLTRNYRAEGDYGAAREIASMRLRMERALKPSQIARMVGWFYETAFDYGLSPLRAVATFSFFIFVGTIGAAIADQGLSPVADPAIAFVWTLPARAGVALATVKPVLVIETSAVNSLAVIDSTAKYPIPSFGWVKGPTSRDNELPCGDQIEPLLFALENFVPALELHQGSRCAVSSKPGAFLWRIAAAIYSIVGWIVTSLTVLTLSGILRRQVEA